MPRALGTYLLIFVLVVMVVLTGYNYFKKPFSVRDLSQMIQTQLDPAENLADQDPIVEQAQSIIANLSPREKLAQLVAMPLDFDKLVATTSAGQAAELIELTQFEKPLRPGFVTVFGSDISLAQVSQAVSEVRPAGNGAWTNPLIAVDHEGGRVARLSGEGFLILPSWQNICAMNLAQRSEALKQSATELKNAGINIVFGPVVDVGTTGSALGNRTCSDDPSVVMTISQEAIKIYQDNGILPVIKHFPGIGGLQTDQHRVFERAYTNDNEVQIYRSLLSNIPNIAVMTSHLGVLNQHPDIPCSLSVDCLSDLKASNPSMLIFTDALNMVSARFDVNNSSTQKTLTQVSYQAISAGNDVLVFSEGVTQAELLLVLDSLESTYLTDPIFAQQVDASLNKIIQYKLSHF